MKNAFLRTLCLFVLFAVVFGTVPVGTVSAQFSSPYGEPFQNGSKAPDGGIEVNPWAISVAADVYVNGKPGAGHHVEFWCKGILSGEGTTVDVGTHIGILRYVNVYGSDTMVEPGVVQCDEGDRVKVTVDGIKSLFTIQKKNSMDGDYSPEIRWHNLDWYLITILVDAEINLNWGSDSSTLFIPKLGVPSTVRTWFNNSTSYADKNIGSTPINESFGDLKSLHLTDPWGRTYLYSVRNAEVCLAGLEFGLLRGGYYTAASFKNTTPYILETIIHKGSAIELGGKVYPGGNFETMASDVPNGGIEVRIMNENGPVCASFEWDFSLLPTSRIVRITGEGSDPRLVIIEGDNLYFPTGIGYDPESLFVFFKKGEERIEVTNGSVMSNKLGYWDERRVVVPLGNSITQGVYEIGITIVGDSSNTIKFLIPGVTMKNKVFLPMVIR